MELGMENYVMRKLIREQGSIAGFSYPFCKLLIKKLKDLWEKDRVFVNGLNSAEEGEKEQLCPSLCPMASLVIDILRIQIDLPEPRNDPSGIKKFIGGIEEFLAIFEDPKENK